MLIFRLERITHGEVDADAIAEFLDVVVRLFGGVWAVDSDTEVEAENEIFHVVTEAEACAKRNGVEEPTVAEQTARMVVCVFCEPYVSCIDKQCSIEVGNDVEAILHVGFELEVTCAVEVVGVVAELSAVVGTWSDGSHAEGADGGRSA